MSTNEIHKILARYYEGSTTLAEETQLRQYFDSGEVAPELRVDRDLFLGLQPTPQKIPFDAGILLQEVVHSLPTEQKSRWNRFSWRSLAAAASIFLIFGMGWFYTYNDHPNAERIPMAETFKDPEQAYAETKKALLFISQKMNKGSDKLASLSKVDDAFSHLDKLSNLGKVRTQEN